MFPVATERENGGGLSGRHSFYLFVSTSAFRLIRVVLFHAIDLWYNIRSSKTPLFLLRFMFSTCHVLPNFVHSVTN